MSNPKQFDCGIASIGLKFPSLGLSVDELARVRGIDPDKFTIGLGCETIALCARGETVVDLGVDAARRALERWDGDLSDIGMIAVGTETAQDMSRPLSAFIAEQLGLDGAVRSYEVKHACYGGTLALRQGLEWKQSGAAGDKAALVIAADVALYGEQDGGEPTQGAGAVAFIIDKPLLASVDVRSFAWSKPAFDFWRPVGESYPRVEGKFSLDCYNDATQFCFEQLAETRGGIDAVIAEYEAFCFHVPFPKMVRKGVNRLGEAYAWSKEESSDFFDTYVDPTMDWNRMVGNCYTASLWIAVTNQLAAHKEGSRIAAFSYGSGYGAELLSLTVEAGAKHPAWLADVESDFAARKMISGEDYLELRSEGKPKLVTAPEPAVANL